MSQKSIIGLLAVGLVGAVVLSFQFTFDKKAATVTTFGACAAAGYPVSESYPRQCRLPNGQTFTEHLSLRAAEAFRACAEADIPFVSVDTVLNKEEGVVEVRWSDPETSAERLLILPYDPLGTHKNCSESAKSILRHVAETDTSITGERDAIALARTYAAQRTKINESEVSVVSVVHKDWPNACLGMPGNTPEDQFCAEVVTPGYEIVLFAKNQTFIYRANKAGTDVRPAQ